MRLRLSALAALALVTAVTACAPSPRPEPTRADRPHVVGYLAAWGTRGGTTIAALPAERLTHILYAFGAVTPDGRAALGNPCLDVGECPDTVTPPAVAGGNFAALRALKARHPHLKLVPSFGGWSGSRRFSDVALTDSSRKHFASSAVSLYIGRWPGLFDGIDIDWEFPVTGGDPQATKRPEDRENYTLLLAELRRQLDSAGARDGRHYELSIAASANPSAVKNLEVPRLAELLDFVGVMTYDYHTGGAFAHFNAPLYAAKDDPTPAFTTDSTVRTYLAAGLPRAKLFTGVPFFGRSWSNVAATNDGLFQPGTPGNVRDWPVGTMTALGARQPEANGFTRHWSAEARVPWYYDPARQVFLSYEDSASIAAKGDFVRERGLGGVIIWQLGGDDGTLLRVLTERMWRRAR